jgi:hypothetical protein
MATTNVEPPPENSNLALPVPTTPRAKRGAAERVKPTTPFLTGTGLHATRLALTPAFCPTGAAYHSPGLARAPTLGFRPIPINPKRGCVITRRWPAPDLPCRSSLPKLLLRLPLRGQFRQKRRQARIRRIAVSVLPAEIRIGPKPLPVGLMLIGRNRLPLKPHIVLRPQFIRNP